MAVVVQWLERAVVVRKTRVRFSPSALSEARRGRNEYLQMRLPSAFEPLEKVPKMREMNLNSWSLNGN